MELIIFASLYQAKERTYFLRPFFYRRYFYLRGSGRSDVAFLSYEKGFGSEENPDVPADARAFVCGLSSPVLGLHSVGRLTSGRFCRVCLGTGDFIRPQGAISPGLYPLRGVGFIAWRLRAPQKGECRRGRRYFWPCRTRVGFGPATGPTLKTALCHIRVLVGRFDKYRGLRGRSQGPLGSTRSNPTLSWLHSPHRHF